MTGGITTSTELDSAEIGVPVALLLGRELALVVVSVWAAPLTLGIRLRPESELVVEVEDFRFSGFEDLELR